jgi:DNA-binding winged helix-turn-helix (wHTH) protein
VTIRFGEFVLNGDARQVLHEGKDLRLSPKAFDLLCMLIARRPGVVSKADLIAKIWPDTFVTEANLNVLVGEIRRALGDDARNPRFLRTAHGVGYAFCGEASEPTKAEPAHAGDTRCWLEWRNRTFTLSEGDNIIGRDSRCDVWLEHSGVSRRHARIRIERDTKTVRLDDLESTNGTFVGRKAVQSEAILSDGDLIGVGPLQLKFRMWSDRSSRTQRIRRSKSQGESRKS